MSQQLLVVTVAICFILLIVIAIELRDLRQEKDLRIDEYVNDSNVTYSEEDSTVSADVKSVLEAMRRQYRAAILKQGRYERLQKFFGIGTIVLIAAYTAINLYQLLATREAFTSVQRAFVTVSNFDTPVRFNDVPGQTAQAKYWWFIPNIKNSGNTPTKNMKYLIGSTCPYELSIAMAGRMTIDCNFTRTDLLDPVDIFHSPTYKGQEPAAILGPQSSIELGGIGITEKSIQAILHGFKMSVFGVVYYNDIFPNTAQHITKFCYVIGANISEKGEIVSSFGFCEHWNCADEECDDDRKAWNVDVLAGKIQKPFEMPKGAKPFNVPIPVVPPGSHSKS